MKNTNAIKKVLNLLTITAIILFFASCNNNQRTYDTKDVAEKKNDTQFDTNQQEKDAQFLVNSAEMSLEEIQLGQLAQHKGTTAQVKELGKMMADAHTQSLQDLSALAQTKRISIPTTPTNDSNDVHTKLDQKSGDEFDKAYTDRLVSEHKDAIDSFEKAATDSYDVDIKNWASASLPDMRKHLDHSIDVQKKSDKM